MRKLNTAFRPLIALVLFSLISLPAWGQSHSTGQLIATLGQGGPVADVKICMEVGRRFRAAPPPQRPAILSRLFTMLESAPEPASRFGAIACLAGMVSSPVDPDSRAAISEMLRTVFSTERDTAILAAAVRMLPDVDRSESSLDLLSGVLNNPQLLRADPKLAKEALLSAGRFGPVAVPFLIRFLPTHPEASMIGLAATGSEEAVERLVREATSSDPDRRYPAVHALGLSAGAESLSPETQALIRQTLQTAARADSDPDVRQKAAERLREVSPPTLRR